MLCVGFTGTRRGLTEKQRHRLKMALCHSGVCEFHHGDCVGADQEAAELVAAFGRSRIVVHPPSVSSQRAYTPWGTARTPKGYLERNRDIVRETQVLVGCPGEQQEILRSGTWATIRFAIKLGRPILLIFPDGSTRMRNS